jgi:hypothetical protein
MSSVTIDTAIDDVFSQDAKGKADAVAAFMDRLHESRRYAAASMYRRTFLVLGLWLAGYLIAVGSISEVEKAGVHIASDHLLSLLPVFPIAIGFVAYELVCAIKAFDVTGKALMRCYWHVLPTGWSHDLERLLDLHAYTDIEDLFSEATESASALQKAMASFVPWFAAGIVAFAPAVAILHLTYLGWRTPHVVGKVLLTASALVGMLFWLRGMLLVTLVWKGPNRVRIE